MEYDDLKGIQKVILDIFKAIDKICETYQLRYYAIGGTCIGAVRHKGFIPWDDDLDIAMPREDYERFIKIAEHELPDYLALVTPEQIRHYECMFVKVQNINTTCIHNILREYPDRYGGVYVDIMPLDGVPHNLRERKKHFRKLRFYGRLNMNQRFKPKNLHTGVKRVIWHGIMFFCKKADYTYYYRKYDAELKKYKFEESNATSYGWSQRAEKLIFPIEDFQDYVELPFEDYHMRCPVGYDHFLTILFGDYMKLPPKEQQEPVHQSLVDLYKSYKEYQLHSIADA